MNLDGTFWAAVAAAAGALTAVAAIWIALGQRVRERRQALADIHRDITTGEVAVARDAIGDVLYGGRRGRREMRAALGAFFRLYWALQRVENYLDVFRLRTWRGRMRRNADRYLTWNYREIVENLCSFRREFKEPLGIEDEDAWLTLVQQLERTSPALYRRYVLWQDR